MAFIRQIEYSESSGELRHFYDRLTETAGGIPNIVRLASLKLPAMRAAQDLYRSVLYHDSPLRMEQKEAVAILVSSIIGCRYCVDQHARSLQNLTGDSKLAMRIMADYRSAGIEDATLVLLTFADKLTRTPTDMTEADVESLRDSGASDEAILDLVQLVAYFNYTARLAVALGVDPETPDE